MPAFPADTARDGLQRMAELPFAWCLRKVAEFEAARAGFFPSLQATLNHILIIV